MAKARLQQIKLASGDKATQPPPFPGGWVLAIFEALMSFAPAFAAAHDLPASKRTQERINAAEAVKQRTYDQTERKLVEVISALFPNVSTINGFATLYVDEYFRLWKQAAEWSPHCAKCLGFEPAQAGVIGRAFLRDILLRLCYLESCERKLTKTHFTEAEFDLLRHDSPEQVYQLLISEEAKNLKVPQERLAAKLRVDDRKLRRIKRGESQPALNLLLQLKRFGAERRVLAGIGFIDQLLKALRLHRSTVRTEFMAIASVFFRHHSKALESFRGNTSHKTASGEARDQNCCFEEYIAHGNYLLLHPGFEDLYAEMPDALWRCHLFTLRLARIADLAQAYFQFSTGEIDEALEEFLARAEHESDGHTERWMDNLRLHNGGLPMPPSVGE